MTKQKCTNFKIVLKRLTCNKTEVPERTNLAKTFDLSQNRRARRTTNDDDDAYADDDEVDKNKGPGAEGRQPASQAGRQNLAKTFDLSQNRSA